MIQMMIKLCLYLFFHDNVLRGKSYALRKNKNEFYEKSNIWICQKAQFRPATKMGLVLAVEMNGCKYLLRQKFKMDSVFIWKTSCVFNEFPYLTINVCPLSIFFTDEYIHFILLLPHVIIKSQLISPKNFKNINVVLYIEFDIKIK